MKRRTYDRGEPVQEPPQNQTTVRFRKATIEVGNPNEFLTGIHWGQRAQVEDEERLTGKHLLQEITSNLTDHPASVTDDWLLGYVIGRVDALLHDRQTCPDLLISGKKAGEHHG
jgi:hypothetical protein